MMGLRMTMYAIVTNVSRPPRTSVAQVLPRDVISKNRSRRPLRVGVGVEVEAEMVLSRSIGGVWFRGAFEDMSQRRTSLIPFLTR